MTDDLVERFVDQLRQAGGEAGVQCDECLPLADAIEALTAQNFRLSSLCDDLKYEVAVDNALLIGEAEASLERLARAEKAEAERDKAYANGYSDAETEISKSALGQGNAFLHSQYANAADRIEALTAERDYTEGTNDTLIALNRSLTADNARLKAALTGIKKAAAHRMQDDPKDLHSYYFHTAAAALNTGKEPMREERFAQCDIFEEEPSHE